MVCLTLIFSAAMYGSIVPETACRGRGVGRTIPNTRWTTTRPCCYEVVRAVVRGDPRLSSDRASGVAWATLEPATTSLTSTPIGATLTTGTGANMAGTQASFRKNSAWAGPRDSPLHSRCTLQSCVDARLSHVWCVQTGMSTTIHCFRVQFGSGPSRSKCGPSL